MGAAWTDAGACECEPEGVAEGEGAGECEREGTSATECQQLPQARGADVPARHYDDGGTRLELG